MPPTQIAYQKIIDYTPEHTTSDRNFGLVFAAVCALIGVWRLWEGKPGPVWWLIAAALFLLVALLFPMALRPLNRGWYRLGLLLNRLVSPVVMALLFYVAVTPTALAFRALGRDILGVRRETSASSYWSPREADSSNDMRRQF